MIRRLVSALVGVALVVLLAAPPARAQGYVYSWATTTLINASITTTTETIGCTTPGVSTRFAGLTVFLWASVIMTPGTGTTAVTLRVRRGTGTTGVIAFSQFAVTVTAGNVVQTGASGSDAPGEVAGQPYTLTVQQTAATGNGTISSCVLQAFVF